MLSSAKHSLRTIAVLGQRSAVVSLPSGSPAPLGLSGAVAPYMGYHTSPSLRDAEPTPAVAADNNNTPPPIIWTTHRLSSEQIAKVDGIFHKVLWLDIFETSTLIELINHRLGLVMTPKQRKALEKQMDARTTGKAGGGSGQTDGTAEEVDQGPKLVDLKLTGFDAKSKIKVIKEVRAIAGLGLKEAKELVEASPKVVQTGLSLEDAEALKAKMEEIGATVELV